MSAAGGPVQHFHVAPVVARSSIRRHGLNPARSDLPTEGLPGVFAFTDLAEAQWYADYQARESRLDGAPMTFDIWTFTAVGGCTDTGLRPTVRLPADEDATTAVYLDDPIPARAVTMLPR